MEPPYRIELIHTSDPHTNLKPGDRGTVTREPNPEFKYDTYWVKWDNGSTLGLVPGEDQFKVIDNG